MQPSLQHAFTMQRGRREQMEKMSLLTQGGTMPSIQVDLESLHTSFAETDSA